MRTNADQRRRIFQLFDINCTKISVQDINDPRQQQLHVRGMRRFDFDLRGKAQVSHRLTAAQRDDQGINRHEGNIRQGTDRVFCLLGRLCRGRQNQPRPGCIKPASSQQKSKKKAENHRLFGSFSGGRILRLFGICQGFAPRRRNRRREQK